MKFKHSLEGVPTFSGESCVIIFIREMEKAFATQPERWSNKLKIQGCKYKLEGLALRLAYSTMSNHTTWQQMKEDLMTMFRTSSIVELLIIRLNKMKRAENQDWLLYYADIRELCVKISYLDSTFDVEKETRLALIGSVDNAMEWKIQERTPYPKSSSLQVLRLIQDNQLKSHDLECKRQEHTKEIDQKHNRSSTYQYLGDAKLPLPCIRCQEWGHEKFMCNGRGNNGVNGKRYPPTYCFNCKQWCWHSSKSSYCPMKYDNHATNQ